MSQQHPRENPGQAAPAGTGAPGTDSARTGPSAPATEVGSYFVSTYPPFSFWKKDHVEEARQVLSVPGDPNVPLGLYLHIPFCRLRCKFCYFRVYTEKSAREVEDYLDALAREVEIYRDLPAIQNRPISFVYFGGGTPSFLSTGQLGTLVERLKAALPWDRAEEVTFECEPGTLSRKKLETIRGLGTTRLSLGVENFDDKILELNGRAHRSPEILRTYHEARDLGFPQINVDLIAGMVGETEENWRDCIQKVAELEPESVTIYQMELPHNTEFSREILHEGIASPVAGWEQKRAWVGRAFQELERAGYEVKSGYTAVKGGAGVKFAYRDSLWHGADMIGAGVASFSYMAGVHYQNVDRFEDYNTLTKKGELPLSRAMKTQPMERLVREMILQLKLGEIDAGYFRNKFGVEVLEEFESTYSSLKQRGLLSSTGDRITLSREGLLRVDELIHEFFLSPHRGARYT